YKIYNTEGRDIYYYHTMVSLEPFLSYRTHNNTVAVRILKAAVHPGISLFGKLLGKLPGRYHHLLVALIGSVTINIHVIELVIETNFLQLSVGLDDQARIPKANIFDCFCILLNSGAREILGRTGIIGLALHFIKKVGLSGLGNAVFYIGHLQFQLTWFYGKLLDNSGKDIKA